MLEEAASAGSLRRQVFGGYRRADVEIIVAKLQVENDRLAERVEDHWLRIQSLEDENRGLREENDDLRSRELELARVAASAQARAHEIEEEAQRRAVELAREARAGLDDEAQRLSSQVEELVRVKQQLVAGVRGVLADFGEVIDQIDSGEPAPQPEPALRVPLAIVPTEVNGEDQLFEDSVEIDAGPFVDFTALSAFERSLARIPKVADVYVRRFTADRALIEVVLSEPAALVSALRALTHGVHVTGVTASRISLDIVSFARATGN